MSYISLKNKNTFYANQLSTLNNINNELENKIFSLSPKTLDLDYLDYQLRFKTGIVKKNELIVLLDK